RQHEVGRRFWNFDKRGGIDAKAGQRFGARNQRGTLRDDVIQEGASHLERLALRVARSRTGLDHADVWNPAKRRVESHGMSSRGKLFRRGERSSAIEWYERGEGIEAAHAVAHDVVLAIARIGRQRVPDRDSEKVPKVPKVVHRCPPDVLPADFETIGKTK